MEEYVTDEQKIEAIKAWFKKHGNKIFWVAITILLAISLTRYWFHHNEVKLAAASNLYSELLTSFEDNDSVSVEAKTVSLQTKHAKSTYASLASMVAAKVAYKNEDYDKAIALLNWVIDNSGETKLQDIAKLRVMKCYMQQQNFEQALAIPPLATSEFNTLYYETRGDIFMQQQDNNAARIAYTEAMQLAGNGNQGPFLQMKKDELGSIPN